MGLKRFTPLLENAANKDLKDSGNFGKKGFLMPGLGKDSKTVAVLNELFKQPPEEVGDKKVKFPECKTAGDHILAKNGDLMRSDLILVFNALKEKDLYAGKAVGSYYGGKGNLPDLDNFIGKLKELESGTDDAEDSGSRVLDKRLTKARKEYDKLIETYEKEVRDAKSKAEAKFAKIKKSYQGVSDSDNVDALDDWAGKMKSVWTDTDGALTNASQTFNGEARPFDDSTKTEG